MSTSITNSRGKFAPGTNHFGACASTRTLYTYMANTYLVDGLNAKSLLTIYAEINSGAWKL